ncbi:MAG: prephenate dehydrogenase/arogenate dehydrogenase family protein [Candidatus Metalachnospira sp.]|nr:prephenate dehydrogenase/arogenate dehydrogenase family protein [Candidatus Metalachnospira sp.]
MYNKVGVIGLGLIGGSLCKALRNRAGAKIIVAFNRSEDVLITAKNEGVIDDYSLEITDMFKGCDIVFICTPVDIIFDYTKKLIPIVGKDCVISDVGSTKGQLYNQMKTLGNQITYIGGHPMAGSERFRYNASKEHLFENAYYIIAPGENVTEEKTAEFKETIAKIGAIPVVISPYEHDYAVAAVSHVPHLIASALVNNVKRLDSDKEYMHLLAAGGFKDITRIASSSADMWESIMFENKDDIIAVLDSFGAVISEIKGKILENKKADVYDYFLTAQQYRNSFSTATPKAFVKRYEIDVDVLDRPGSIAIIAVLFSSNGINIKNMGIVNSRENNSGALSFAFDCEEDRQKSVKLLRDMNYDVTVKE